jgi:hypothetical protein
MLSLTARWTLASTGSILTGITGVASNEANSTLTVSEANSTLTVSLSALADSSFLAFNPTLAFSNWALGFSTLVPNADETNFTDAIVARPARQNKASQIVLIIGVHPDSFESYGCVDTAVHWGFDDFNRNSQVVCQIWLRAGCFWRVNSYGAI